MKKLFTLIAVLALILSLTATAENQLAEDWSFPDEDTESAEDTWDAATDAADTPQVGGWEMTDMESAKGGEALQALFDKAVAGLTGVTYTPAALLATQTVNGNNYCILAHCDYTESGTSASGWALVYIYEAFGGEVQLTNVVDLNIADLADYGLLH